MTPYDSHNTGNIAITDLSWFKYGDLQRAMELLNAYLEQSFLEQSLPEDWCDNEVQIHFNTASGYVFLSNSDYQVMMIKNGKLEIWYTCPKCGAEGFAGGIQWNQEQGICGECCSK